jgi:hypothetical protein
MKTPFAATLSIAAGLLAAALPSSAQDDAVMKAMRDEMARSMQQLRLGQLEKPYFIAYRLQDTETAVVGATFGSLTDSTRYRMRLFQAEVRVGDYKLDNTNFISGSGFGRMGGQTWRLPFENDYREIRRQIWLATDAAYKKAVEDFSKKRAALQNKNQTEQVPDFSREEPATHTDQPAAIPMNIPQWESMARELSGLFRQAPEVFSSAVQFWAGNSRVLYLTSEGTSYTQVKPEMVFIARASTQAPDGMPLGDSVYLPLRSAADLPGKEQLAARLREMGTRLKQLRAAPLIDTYNGPVLFEGEAAPEIFQQIFVPNLTASHRLISDNPSMQGGGSESPFIDKIGARVLPEFLSVTDDPTAPLAGAARFDDEGVASRRVALVENGILKTLLTSRSPARGLERSTGSRHGGGPAPSNLLVTAANPLPAAELRQKFLSTLKQRNKEYGIVVRKLGGMNALLAYKVFPDGREELIRNASLSGLTAATFKEILAASRESFTQTTMYRGRSAAMSQLSGTAIMAIVAPAVLFEDVTLHKMRGEVPKPPAAGHPYFER